MMKKKIKKTDLSATERRFGVVLENIDSKMNLVLEGHQALDVKFSKKFDKVDEKLKDIDEKINVHTEILNSHTKILNSHTETLDSHTKILNSHAKMISSMAADIDMHTKMIGSIATDVEITKSNVEFIKNSLKKKVDIDEFSVLEKRVTLLEKKLQRI